MSYHIDKTLNATPEQAVENPELGEIAGQVRARLQRVIEAI